MPKLFSIIFFVATIAFLSIIASADEEQRHFLKRSRLNKRQTPTSKNRGNPVNLNPAAADAFAYWTPGRIRSAVPIELFVDGPAPSGLGDIHPLLTVPEDHWSKGGAVQKAAGRLFYSFGTTNYFCSGTSVTDSTSGRSIIITAAHCVFDDENKQFSSNGIFIPNQDDGGSDKTDWSCANDPYGCWALSFGVVEKGWASQVWPNNIDYDYAFYVVRDTGAHQGTAAPDALDVAVGSLPISFANPILGSDTYALGYSYNKDPLFRYCVDPLQTRGNGWWLPNCGLSGGASGGPWVLPMDVTKGSGTIISVNSYGFSTAPGMGSPKLYGTSAEQLFNVAKTWTFTSVVNRGVIVDPQCPAGFTFNACANCNGCKFTTTADLIGAVNGYPANQAFYGEMNCWDVSSITDMKYLFSFDSLNEPIGCWDVGSVTDMYQMFIYATNFNQPIGNWNVGSVTDMNSMFYEATNFNQPIGNWNVGKVTDMRFMFDSATNFNQPIWDWNVGSVTDMYAMFFHATNFNQPIGNWNVGKVRYMWGMFSNTNFNRDIGNWNVGKVTDMHTMFSFTNFNQPIGIWNVSSVTDMNSMFSYATNFNQPIGNWNVSSVSDMSNMFSRATNFNQPIGNWNVSSVTDMNFMFEGATNFNQPIGNWNVGSVTDMKWMFYGATSFNQPIGNWNVGSVTNMWNMFKGATKFNQAVGNWNVSRVTDMGYMFSGASSFNQDLCSWYNSLQSTTSVSDMFPSSGCTVPADPNLSKKSSFCQACTCSEGKKYSELG
jgi:surface protein